MNFIEAMKLLQLDKNIKLKRRNKDFEVTFVLISLNLTINDILAEDWYVVRDEKLHTFEEAIALLRKGKSIRRKAWTNRFSVDANDCFNNYSNYCFSTDDLDAKDWIIKERK